MEIMNLDLWTNLVVIFGRVEILIVVLATLFLWYAVKADINKWAITSFLLVFLFWVGTITLNFLTVFVLITIALIFAEVIRRILGER